MHYRLTAAKQNAAAMDPVPKKKVDTTGSWETTYETLVKSFLPELEDLPEWDDEEDQ